MRLSQQFSYAAAGIEISLVGPRESRICDEENHCLSDFYSVLSFNFHFKAQPDAFSDVLHQFVDSVPLAMASSELRDFADVDAVFILFYYDMECPFHSG